MSEGDAERAVFSVGAFEVVLADSITQVCAADAGRIMVSGSHGGRSAGRYAAIVRAALYAFNDAGVGKDEAGIAALADLDALGIAALAVCHDSARIGSARETWDGRVAHVNEAADRLGVELELALRDAVGAIRT